jgi:hypothetical protein
MIKLVYFLSLCFFSTMLFANSEVAENNATQQQTPPTQSENWLKQRFSEQHEKLIPIVAVADMFFSCNRASEKKTFDYQIKDLVNHMDKNELAEKLVDCLNGQGLQSDVALNYGLVGCFHAQMSHLKQQEYDEKMNYLVKLLPTLSREERQKSFTQCVTDQAIYFLK